MYAIQTQVIESFVRVRGFLEANPATGELTYGGAGETLREVLERVQAHASTQVSARALGRAALRHQEQLMKRLRDRHMRPIVTIARAQIEPDSDVRLPAALRMPRVRIGVTKLLTACDGMMEVARTFETVLIGDGLPSDFLARFKGARDELERVYAHRATLSGASVGARKGLEVELRRGRRGLDRLDAIVRIAFEGDEEVLAAWRTTKRVHKLPGGASTGVPAEVDAPEPVREPVTALEPIATGPSGLRLAA